MEGLLVLLLAGVSFVAAIVSLIVAGAGRGWVPRRPPSTMDAQQILDERLARGQVDLPDYLARSAANDRSWQIFLETSGLGVGLGSHRPSSLFFLVLSCLGLVGTVLLAVLIAVALRRAARTEPAAGWALLGVVVSGVIAVPDLSMPVIWVGVAVCVAGAGFDTPLRGYSTGGSGTELLQGSAAQVPALQRTEPAK